MLVNLKCATNIQPISVVFLNRSITKSFVFVFQGGHYMYIETSAPRNAGDKARLVSPQVTPSGQRNACRFTFWYHMYGSNIDTLKGVLHLWALFFKTLCIFSKNKATSDKVSYGPGQKYSKELNNHSFTSVETIVVKLQWKMCENQYFPCFEP